MNKFWLIYTIFVGVWFLDICCGLIEPLLTKFWIRRGRCPRCLKSFWAFSDFGFEFGYCPNHPEQAYYEDGTKVMFRE